MKIITVYNQKGGVGKSTIACNLTCRLAKAGYDVFLVDSDQQGTATDFTKIRAAQNDSALDFATAQILTANIHKTIHRHKFDYIIIDASGRDNNVSRSAALAADIVLLPIRPSGVDLWASEEVMEYLADVQNLHHHLKIIAFLNMMMSNMKIASQLDENMRDMQEDFEFILMQNKIKQRLAYSYSLGEGKPIFEYGDKLAKDEFELWYSELMGIITGE